MGIHPPQIRSHIKPIWVGGVLRRNHQRSPVIVRIRRGKGATVVNVTNVISHLSVKLQPVSRFPLQVVIQIVNLLMLRYLGLCTVLKGTEISGRSRIVNAA